MIISYITSSTQMMVEIISNEDSLVFDFSTVTSSGEGEDEVSGLEAAMQVSSILI